MSLPEQFYPSLVAEKYAAALKEKAIEILDDIVSENNAALLVEILDLDEDGHGLFFANLTIKSAKEGIYLTSELYSELEAYFDAYIENDYEYDETSNQFFKN